MQEEEQQLQVQDDGRYLLDSAWQKQQEKTFTAWCNSHLRKRKVEISKIDEDFRDGLKLMLLLELISDEKIGRPETKKIRFHYINNVQKALNFIKDHGVRLVGIGAEEIVDGNLKMTLGMIWTVILRFSIQDISVGERSAKEGLLLWCQRKTKPYKNVNVQNFHMSWKDGLAFCALIHRHRPDLIDYDSLKKEDPLTNLNKAFDVAEKHLDIPRMLDADDLVNNAKPDERSVMTYVACYYHAFSDQHKAEKASERICKVLNTQRELQDLIEEYERLSSDLLAWINEKCPWLEDRTSANQISLLQQKLDEFRDYRRDQKPPKAQEKGQLESTFNTLQTKLRLSNRPAFVPSDGHMVSDIANAWKRLEAAEKGYEEWLTQEIRRLEALENLARKFHHRVKMHESWTDGKLGLLQSDDYMSCNLQEIKAMLKRHEAFETDLGAHQGRVEKIAEIAETLKAANPEYHDIENVSNKNQNVCDQWNELGQQSGDRKERIMAREAELEEIEKLKLEYAKRATQFNNWLMSAIEDLEDTFDVHSIKEINDLKADHEVFKESNGSAEEEKNSIVAYVNNQGADYENGNHYTTISPKEIDENWNRIQDLVIKRDQQLEEELERQKHHEALRVQFAELAESLGPKLKENKEKTTAYATQKDVKEEDILKNLENHEALCQGLEPEISNLEQCHQEVTEARVYDNPHTAYTMEQLRVEWVHLKTSVARTISEVKNQILLRDANIISSEQMNEYRQSFNHFDQDGSGELSYDEMSGCLTSLGYEIERNSEEGEAKFLEIMKKADRNCRNSIMFEDFINFMIAENQDKDTADQVIESFKVLAGDKDYIMPDQLRRELPPDEAEYCLSRMTPYEGQGAPEGALDYRSFSTGLYGESDL